jgi:hypothetical protein
MLIRGMHAHARRLDTLVSTARIVVAAVTHVRAHAKVLNADLHAVAVVAVARAVGVELAGWRRCAPYADVATKAFGACGVVGDVLARIGRSQTTIARALGKIFAGGNSGCDATARLALVTAVAVEAVVGAIRVAGAHASRVRRGVATDSSVRASARNFPAGCASKQAKTKKERH